MYLWYVPTLTQPLWLPTGMCQTTHSMLQSSQEIDGSLPECPCNWWYGMVPYSDEMVWYHHYHTHHITSIATAASSSLGFAKQGAKGLLTKPDSYCRSWCVKIRAGRVRNFLNGTSPRRPYTPSPTVTSDLWTFETALWRWKKGCSMAVAKIGPGYRAFNHHLATNFCEGLTKQCRDSATSAQ